MKLFIILGNQLFPLKYLNRFKKDHLFFMAEDNGLCTYEKHHKLKILLFLSSMRSFYENLKKNSFKITYSKIEDSTFKDDYLLKSSLVLRNIGDVIILSFILFFLEKSKIFFSNGLSSISKHEISLILFLFKIFLIFKK